MELYEAMIITSPDVEKEEQEEVINGLSAAITKNGGSVDTILDWRKRRLAYEIDKYQEGFYYLVYFRAQGTIIPEIEHYFRVTDAVIRYMVVRTDEQEFEAAAKKAVSEAAAAEKAAAAEEAAAEEAAPNEETVEAAEAVTPTETAEAAVGQNQEEAPQEPEGVQEQAEEDKPAGE